MNALLRLTWFALVGWWLTLVCICGIMLMMFIPPLWPIAFATAMKLDTIAFLG